MPSTPKQAPESAFTTAEVFYFLFRYKWSILIALLLGAVAAGVVYLRTPGVYRSEAKLLVRYVTESTAFDPDVRGSRVISPDQRGGGVMGAEVEILSSRDLVEGVVDAVGGQRFLSGPTNLEHRLRVVQQVARSLQFESPRGSNIIRVQFDAHDPKLAQEVLQQLIDRYLEKHLEIHRALGAYEFLSKQTDQLRGRLTQTEEDLRRVRAEVGIVSLPDSRTAAMTRLSELQRALFDAEVALAASRARQEALQGQLAGRQEQPTTNAVSGAPPVNERAYQLLVQLTEREQAFLGVFTEESSPVREIRRQIEQATKAAGITTLAFTADASTSEVSLTAQSVAVANVRTLLDEKSSSAGLEAQINLLKEKIQQVHGEILGLENVEGRITDLMRRKDIQENNYKYFVENLEQARIDDALDIRRLSNISLVEPPTYPASVTRPNVARNMAIAIALGLFGGIGIAMLREYVVLPTLHRPVQIEAVFHVPTLLTIPVAHAAHGLLPRRAEAPVPLLPAHAQQPSAGGAPRKDKAGSWTIHPELREYYEALRERVFMALRDCPARPVLLGVTGCAPGSGASSIAAGLALSFAQAGTDRVLLMDADQSHAAHQRIFSVDAESGLVDLVSDEQGNTAILQRSLYVVPADETKRATPRSRSQRFAELIDRLRNSNSSMVVVDLPPVSQTSLTLSLARLLDGVLLVVPSETLNRDAADSARRLLEQTEAKLIGTVLNKHRNYVPSGLGVVG